MAKRSTTKRELIDTGPARCLPKRGRTGEFNRIPQQFRRLATARRRHGKRTRATGMTCSQLHPLLFMAMIGRALNPANQLSKRKRARRHHPSRAAPTPTGTLKEGGIVGKVGAEVTSLVSGVVSSIDAAAARLASAARRLRRWWRRDHVWLGAVVRLAHVTVRLDGLAFDTSHPLISDAMRTRLWRGTYERSERAVLQRWLDSEAPVWSSVAELESSRRW